MVLTPQVVGPLESAEPLSEAEEVVALDRDGDGGVGRAGGRKDVDPSPADSNALPAESPKCFLPKEADEGAFAVEAYDQRPGPK